MFLDGEEIHTRGPRGERIVDESFLVVLHAGAEPVGFTLPGVPWAKSYEFALDTSTDDEPIFTPEAGPTLDLTPRSVVLLRAALTRRVPSTGSRPGPSVVPAAVEG